MTEFEAAARRVREGADPRQEARALVDQMSLDEQLACLDGDIAFWPGIIDLSSGGYHTHPWPAVKNTRLGVPGLDFSDGPRGCVIGACTAFPVSMARGASFDPDLERRVGRAIGIELRAQGATFTGAVCLNLLRHPAWGRAQETYGEDPHHVGEMALALTEGLQEHVMACMKHFALNSMENARFQVDIEVDERSLHETYLPHFKRVADGGVASVMSSYNAMNGEWCGENRVLLRDILRDEWGWDGFVITDFAFGLRDAVKSVGAGCNVEMPFRQHRAVHLPGALDSGELASSEVEDRAVETLATFLRFAHVFAAPPPPHRVACAEHRALAREAAAASMVLLRNRGALLPVAPHALSRVAVLGRLAAVPNLGDGGSSNGFPPEVITPLAGLEAALPDAEVVHANADTTITADADLVVVVVGYTKEDEGEFVDPEAMQKLSFLYPPSDHPETGFPPDFVAPPPKPTPDGGMPGFAAGGDRSSLRLRPEDEALIAAACAAHDRVVVAVMAGSAVVMPWLETPAATLLLWYPGMEGGHALADVLLGASEPGGRLPFAVPVRDEDLVPFDKDATAFRYDLLHGQWWLDHQGTAPHLPFGYGLGYTEFAIETCRQQDESVQVTVTNRGARAGSTVVQLYGSVPSSERMRPPKRLLAFRRVALDAGASATVALPLDVAPLDIREGGRWLREDAAVELHIGFDAIATQPLK
ncbi:MAG: glycoside hydrolase family 3 N-terminal domain-containing protein [Myxococcota bacterium]